MSARPPLPKRRVPPPPAAVKPISRQNSDNSISEDGAYRDADRDHEAVSDNEGAQVQYLARRRSTVNPLANSPSAALAAIFSNMQTKNQSNKTPPPPSPRLARAVVPPLPPRKVSGDVPLKANLTGSASKDDEGEVDVARLVARRPPPPPRPPPSAPVVPSRAASVPPQPPQRAVPPPPPPRPTPVPSLPARAPVPTPVIYEEPEGEEAYAPVEQAPNLPSRRRLPPMPTRHATPPPPMVNISTKPKVSAAVALPPPPHDVSEDSTCFKCRDFSEVDYHASLFPRQNITTLPALAHDLTSPFHTQTEKARVIFTWLHHNIIYDVESFMSGDLQPSTPESTLRSGFAVCDGFAGLFAHLAKLAGLEEVYKVTGHGKGVGYRALGEGEPLPPPSSNHAWNCILMDGEWRLIDSCWGAGALLGSSYSQRFEPFWFTADPIEFGKQHFPIEDPGYQLLTDEMGGPISWEEYITEPERPTIFGPFKEQGLDAMTLEPACGVIEGGGMVTFSVYKRCEHMSTAEADNYVFLISTSDNTRTPLTLNGMGGWSVSVHVPRGAEMSLYYVTVLGTRDAFGVSLKDYSRAVGKQGMQFGGLARWQAV